jgi:fructose-1,6-bisphosphatase I
MQLTHGLKPPGFNPVNLSSEKPVSSLAFTFNLYRYTEGNVDNDLAIIINSIAVACKKISNLVATAPIRGLTGMAGSSNESGDEQKKLDIISNDIFCECIKDTARSSVVVTEEEDTPVGVDAISGDYIVTFDPIDGSSNIDAAVPTGSIFGIYSPGECVVDQEDDAEAALEKCVLNTRKSGEELVCAGYVMYSSATVMMISVGHGVYGFTLDWTTGRGVVHSREYNNERPQSYSRKPPSLFREEC